MRIFHNSKPHTGLLLASLLCAGQALAVDVIYVGPPGSSGLSGSAPGMAGGNGLMAPPASQVLFTFDPTNTLSVTGGAGGQGGNGAAGNSSLNGGAAGAGGAGATTTASMTMSRVATVGTLSVLGTGGIGGNPGVPGAAGSGTLAGAGANGGAGGDADSKAIGFTSAGAPLSLSATAVGGSGGGIASDGATAGKGGAATASSGLADHSVGVVDLTMVAAATGGSGGTAASDFTYQYAYGGDGGMATATTNRAYSGNTLSIQQSATGGAGGDTIFGVGGRGGAAYSTVSLPELGGALAVNVSSTAVGGNGGATAGNPFEGLSGSSGAGGHANSTVALASTKPASGGWSATITGTSTATGGMAGNGLGPAGGNANASITIQAYGTVSSSALANGASGGEDGGHGSATASASSNYIATANATANGGGSFFNPGAGATAHATANSSYFASANAVANAGYGHAGSSGYASAVAEANVLRTAATALPPAPSQPSEARAHAVANASGSDVLARSSYDDSGLGASVVATAATTGQAFTYQPEATSAANVGGGAYAAWNGPDDNPALVVSYASALPDAASVTSLLASSPTVGAAFADARTLGAGTMGAMFFPFTSTAAFNLAFNAGDHLLLGLVSPFLPDDFIPEFTFSVSNGGTPLFSGSFSSAAQADSFFNDHVLDLGAINASTLDLLITFSLASGAYGFSYVLGESGGVTAVPEPLSWLLMTAGLMLVMWRVAIKRRSSPGRTRG